MGKTLLRADHIVIVLCRGDHVPYYAVSALTEFLGDIVALVYNEVLVEDLEDLSPMEVCHCARVMGSSCCCESDRSSSNDAFGGGRLSRWLDTLEGRAW